MPVWTQINKTCNLVKSKIVFKNVEIIYTSVVKFIGINISNKVEYPLLVFILKVKQGILYDHINERWLRCIYFKKYIFCKTSVMNEVWYNFMQWGNRECEGTRNKKKGTLCN
jgi:hypothetical protein